MSIAQLCTNFVNKPIDVSKVLDKNILEFCTATWGLGLGTVKDVPALYPAQRFILKCYYGLELDNTVKDIIIKDQFNENVLYQFSEVEYLHYLWEEKRINSQNPYGDKENLILVCGRRSGKTSIAACIIAYETYRLLNKYCPQEYYGIMPDDDIRVTCVSTGKEAAAELFNKVTGHMERCEFFRKFRNKPTMQRMLLRSQRDLDKYGKQGRSTISVNVAPCSAKGLRGHNNIIVVLDEMAFFFADEKKMGDEGNNPGSIQSDKNDKSIYNAVTPSVAKFKKPDGTPDGKIICISSPYGKMGKFYEEFERSWSDKNNDLFMLQASSWEIDPNISSVYLRNKHSENSVVFESEFGARFSDKRRGWIEDPSVLRQNIVPGLKYKFRSLERIPHFAGVDVGLKEDGSSICIGHWTTEIIDGQKTDKIEVDCSETMYAREAGKDYLTPDDIVEWLSTYTDRFYIIKGLMDQYYGFSIVPKLLEKGISLYEYRSFNETLNSNIYQNLYSALMTSTLRFPEGEKRVVEGTLINDTDLVAELLTLQSVQKSRYLIRVKAPDRAGMHDDASDALARMVQLATEYKIKGGVSKVSPVISARARAFRMLQTREMSKVALNRPTSTRGLGIRPGMGFRTPFPSRMPTSLR